MHKLNNDHVLTCPQKQVHKPSSIRKKSLDFAVVLSKKLCQSDLDIVKKLEKFSSLEIIRIKRN